MVADYFTKPLQGELFYKFRDQIMGVVAMDTITGDHRSVLDEQTNATPVPEPVRSSDADPKEPARTSIAHPKEPLRSSFVHRQNRAVTSNPHAHKSAHRPRKGAQHLSWADIVKRETRTA